jgi:hypothetical protein
MLMKMPKTRTTKTMRPQTTQKMPRNKMTRTKIWMIPRMKTKTKPDHGTNYKMRPLTSQTATDARWAIEFHQASQSHLVCGAMARDDDIRIPSPLC